MVKNLPAMWETWGSIPELGVSPGRYSWRREWQPTPVLLPGGFHELRNLVVYSRWCHKESDTTERIKCAIELYLKKTTTKKRKYVSFKILY